MKQTPKDKIENVRVGYVLPTGRLWAGIINELLTQYAWLPVFIVSADHQDNRDSVLADVPDYSRKELIYSSFGEKKFSSGFTELDGSILEFCAPKFPILFEMLRRSLDPTCETNYEAMRSHIFRQLDISLSILKRHRPNVLIAASGPHRTFDYALEIICDFLNIPYLFPFGIAFNDIHFISDGNYSQFDLTHCKLDSGIDYEEETLDSARELLEKNRAEHKAGRVDGEVSAVQLGLTREKILAGSTVTRNWWYLKQYLKIFRSFLKNQSSETIISLYKERTTGLYKSRPCPIYKIHLAELSKSKNALRLREWYQSKLSEPSSNETYVLFAASYQPERSTVPDGGYFYDASLVFDMLESTVPDDWAIYYKEHPSTFKRWPVSYDYSRKLEDYLRILRACPRVKFIDPLVSASNLIDEAIVVAATNGTILWETIIRGKPVLNFGEGWLKSAPGVFHVSCVTECQQAVDAIAAGHQRAEIDLIRFVAGISTMSAPLKSYFRENVRLRYPSPEQENFTDLDINIMANAIETRFRAVKPI